MIALYLSLSILPFLKCGFKCSLAILSNFSILLFESFETSSFSIFSCFILIVSLTVDDDFGSIGSIFAMLIFSTFEGFIFFSWILLDFCLIIKFSISWGSSLILWFAVGRLLECFSLIVFGELFVSVFFGIFELWFDLLLLTESELVWRRNSSILIFLLLDSLSFLMLAKFALILCVVSFLVIDLSVWLVLFLINGLFRSLILLLDSGGLVVFLASKLFDSFLTNEPSLWNLKEKKLN